LVETWEFYSSWNKHALSPISYILERSLNSVENSFENSCDL
jgi:hypothetical protein